MKAGKQRTFNNNLIKKSGLRIIPSVVIYGANASGKSNVIMSLAVMKEIILAGTLEVNVSNINNLELFPFAHCNEDDPMIFEIEFIHKGYHVIYQVSILLNKLKKGKRKIVSEILYVVDDAFNKVKIYDREFNKVQIMKDKKALEIINFNEKLLKEFEKKINENLDDNELFLSRAFKSTISNELAEIVIDFFKEELFVVSDFTLKKANLTFALQEKPKKDFFVWNKILDGFVKNADFGPQSIVFKSNKMDNNEAADMELVSIYEHNNQKVIIPAELMESRGTLKLIDFAIPFEHLFSTGGVFIVDEFDAAIHPELIKGIIALFNNPEINKMGAQLIFTTHNPIYLNNKIFRRDQIRFVEKDKHTYESVIYSLADFGSEEVRNDHNYLINYFKGNYGALPFIDFSKLLNPNNSEEGKNEIL
jgi:AAA15 family ATPase/GTPase